MQELTPTELRIISDLQSLHDSDRCFKLFPCSACSAVRLINNLIESKSQEHKYYELAKEVADAVTYPGINPRYHQKVLNKHRSDWSYLWERLDKLVEEIQKDK